MRSNPMNHPIIRRGLLVACSLAAVSCHRLEEKEAITETREISSHARKQFVDIPSATRFYDDAPEKEQEPQQRPNLRSLLTWTIPEGWTESASADPSGMRAVDLRFGPNQEGECYISLMPGPAGGLEANVNRWRTQMGQPPYTPEEIAQLGKKPFFNREATFVAFDGDFKSFGAERPLTGYRLLGLIHSAEQATIFVKLTGPKALVEANAAAFDAFCQSIRPNVPKE